MVIIILLLLPTLCFAGIDFTGDNAMTPIYNIPEFSTENEAIQWANQIIPLPHVAGQLIRRTNVALSKVNEVTWNNAEGLKAGDIRMISDRWKYNMVALVILKGRMKRKDFAMITMYAQSGYTPLIKNLGASIYAGSYPIER